MALLKFHRSTGLVAGFLCLAFAPPALAGPNVTIRVEGKAETHVEEQRIATPDGPVSSGDGNSCAGNTPLGAMHQTVAGDWSGAWYGSSAGYFVERIRGETYLSDGSTPDGWTYWVNGREPTAGPCGYTAQEGDEILWLVPAASGTARSAPTIRCCPSSCGCPRRRRPACPAR